MTDEQSEFGEGSGHPYNNENENELCVSDSYRENPLPNHNDYEHEEQFAIRLNESCTLASFKRNGERDRDFVTNDKQP